MTTSSQVSSIIPKGVLTRVRYMHDRTLGSFQLYLGPVIVFRCVTLELPWAGNGRKVSCVPAGLTYACELEYSPHFNEHLYELKGVPGRSECKWHAANFPENLLGCIAPAMAFGDIDGDGDPDATSSKEALRRLHEALDGHNSWLLQVESGNGGRDYLRVGQNGWRSGLYKQP